MSRPETERKPSRLRLWAGLFCAALPMMASKSLIIPGAAALILGGHEWLRADSPVSAVACWLWGLILMVESFNYEGGWKRGGTTVTRAVAATVFFVGRISAIMFYGLLIIVSMFYGQWLLLPFMLAFFLLTFFDLAQRVRTQALEDERLEGERLRAFINPERFVRQHQSSDKK